VRAEWWGNPSDCLESPDPEVDCSSRHYQFGKSSLLLVSSDIEFAARFHRIFAECVSRSPSDDPATCVLRIHPIPQYQVTLIQYKDTAPADRVAFVMRLFGDRDYQLMPVKPDGWSLLRAANESQTPVLAFKGEYIVADWRHAWQLVIGHYVLANAMRLQPEVCFFHGATVALEKGGIMLGGDKGAGKTTLSLALADRGHGFMADEYAAIEAETGSILPIRRAVSIRRGPQTLGVERYFSEHDGEVEVLPDGSTRRRVAVGKMFPQQPKVGSKLTHAFFLVGFGEVPEAKVVELGVEHLHLMSPLIGSLWGQPVAHRVLMFLRIFSRVPCYLLTVGGTPAETAKYLEDIVEGYHCANSTES
jgi:hypothetical protein